MLALFFIFTFITLMISNAYATDLQPADLIPLKSDLTLIQFSYLQSDFSKSPSLRYNTAQSLVRLGRSFEIEKHPSLFYVQTPAGYVHPQEGFGASKGDSGIGDTTMLLAFWPYANRETQTYFAVGGYLTLPTGSFNGNRAFNMGANRYQSAIQAGYQTPIYKNIEWSAAFDTLWSGDNHDYFSATAAHTHMEQDPLYTLQTALRYTFNPTYAAGLTYFYTEGGDKTINGVANHLPIELQRYQLTLTGQYSFGRLTFQYGEDIQTENNYKEDQRVIFRYTKVF